MIKKTMIFLLAGASVFTACKKTETTTQTTAQKVLGKWTFVSAVGSQTYQGTTTPSSHTGVAGDYVDFRTDGKVYIYNGGDRDTSNYKIISDNLIKVDSDTAQIKTLTTSSFVVYSKTVAPQYSYESTTTLKK